MMMQDKAYTIVLGIDFSEASDLALDEALALSMARHAELHVLHVDDQFRPSEGAREAAEIALSRIEHHVVARMEDLGRRKGYALSFRRIYSHFRMGASAEQLAQLASDLEADIVVVGTHGRSGLKRLFLGSVAERVVRLARCPVWVVRPKDHRGLGKVPEIEPPCPDCLAKRNDTRGASLWCERHSEHHARPHTLHYDDGNAGDHGASGTTTTPT